MRRVKFLAAIAALLLAVSAGTASAADTLITFNPGEPNTIFETNFYNIGNEFHVGASNLQVTEIGAFVNAADITDGQLNGPFTANLYIKTGASTGTLLDTVVIPVNTPVDASGFAYASLSEILSANTNYVVTDFRGTQNSPGSTTPFGFAGFTSPTDPVGTWGPGTTFVQNWFNSDSDPTVFPSEAGGHGFSEFVGGNLIYTPVPEPSSLALLGLGLVGLAAYGRRRRSS